jgi:nucleotide-binding universal stress UspA family protein
LSIKSILVHVDPSPACEERVRLTMHLAHRFKARVTGAFVVPSLDMLAPPESGAAAVMIASWLAELEERAATTGQQFLARLRDDGIDGNWHIDTPPPRIRLRVTAPEYVILGCGRPVVIVPYVGRFDQVGENATIARNGSRECARAAHDALPLLGPANKLEVVSINPESGQDELLDDLVRNLALSGLCAKAETHVTQDLFASWLDTRACRQYLQRSDRHGCV